MKHAQSIHSQRPDKRLRLLIIVKQIQLLEVIKETHVQKEIRNLACIQKISETLEDLSKDFGTFDKMNESMFVNVLKKLSLDFRKSYQ